MVSSATRMYMVMLATFSSSILFTLVGRMLYGYAAFLNFYLNINFFFGRNVVNKAVVKYGRTSILDFILATVIVLGTLVTPVLGIF
jgi:hypothetical protein